MIFREGPVGGIAGREHEGVLMNGCSTAAMGGAYEFSKNASANLREKDDAWNPALGGFFAGTMMGLRCMALHIFPSLTGPWHSFLMSVFSCSSLSTRHCRLRHRARRCSWRLLIHRR